MDEAVEWEGRVPLESTQPDGAEVERRRMSGVAPWWVVG